MSTSTIRKAIGAVKDQTSIGIAKVASNNAPELEVAVVKATSHDDDPADEKYIRNILNMTSYSRGYVHACVSAVAKRLGKTRDWIVALKALVLVHRLLNEGDPVFREEILYATKKGTRLLNMSDFRDEAHSSSWDHSANSKRKDWRKERRLANRSMGLMWPSAAAMTVVVGLGWRFAFPNGLRFIRILQLVFHSSKHTL